MLAVLLLTVRVGERGNVDGNLSRFTVISADRGVLQSQDSFEERSLPIEDVIDLTLFMTFLCGESGGCGVDFRLFVGGRGLGLALSFEHDEFEELLLLLLLLLLLSLLEVLMSSASASTSPDKMALVDSLPCRKLRNVKEALSFRMING